MSPTANKRRGRSSSKSTNTALDDNHSLDEQSPPGMAVFDLNLRRQQQAGRRRRPFTPARRSEVAGVRKVGACAYCRKKKITCKHALERINRGASPTRSTSSRLADSFKVEHPDLYLESNSTVLQPEVKEEHLPSVMDSTVSNDSTEWMLRTVPAAGKHLDRIALEIHDFDASFGDFSTSLHDSSYPVPDWRSFPHDSSSELEMQLSEPSSRSDYPLFSPLSPISSSASEGDFNLALPTAARVFYCEVQGCDLRHGFALEFDLRCHQESKHPNIFPPYVTFTCPVDGCRHQLWPFVRKENLEEHKRHNHPDFVHYKEGLDTMDAENIDLLGLGKKEQFEQYLASMNNDYVVFPQRNRVPGENPPWLQRDGRVTTSSRGGVHTAPSRRQADMAQDMVGPMMIPLRPAPVQSNERGWINNNTVPILQNDMRSPYNMVPSPYIQAGPVSQPGPSSFGFSTGDMSFSYPPQNPYDQQSQFYGPPPPPVNHQPTYPDQSMSRSMFRQQDFVNPYENPNENPNGYPVGPLREGPPIWVQQPSSHESDALNGTNSSFMPSPIQSSSTDFINPYVSQHSWQMIQVPQPAVMQNLLANNNCGLSVDGTNSISNYEYISAGSPSITISSNSSEIIRPSVASPFPTVTQGSVSQSPPVLEPSGAVSISSVASPYTFVEVPMVDVSGLDVIGFEDAAIKIDTEDAAECSEDVTVELNAENNPAAMAFYGLAPEMTWRDHVR